MATKSQDVEALVKKEYEHGFVTEIDADTVAPGLNEDVIRLISKKKNEPGLKDFGGQSFRDQIHN